MKTSTCTTAILLALDLIAVAGEVVSFQGLNNTGGRFSTSISGKSVIPITVSALAGSGNGLSQTAEGTAGRLLRLEDLTPGTIGQTIITEFSLAEPDVFKVSTNSGDSNINDRDKLSFVALGVSAGFAWTALNLDTANTSITFATTNIPGDTVIISGNGQGNAITPFAKFALSPNQAISKFRVTCELKVAFTSGGNSSRFDIALSQVPRPLIVVSTAFPNANLAFSNLVPSTEYRLMRSGAVSGWQEADRFVATAHTRTWSEPIIQGGKMFYRLEWNY